MKDCQTCGAWRRRLIASECFTCYAYRRRHKGQRPITLIVAHARREFEREEEAKLVRGLRHSA